MRLSTLYIALLSAGSHVYARPYQAQAGQPAPAAETAKNVVAYGEKVELAGPGIKQAEFPDGARVIVKPDQAMILVANQVQGVDQELLPAGAQPLDNFTYAISTSLAGAKDNHMQAALQLPINKTALADIAEEQQKAAQASDEKVIVIVIVKKDVVQEKKEKAEKQDKAAEKAEQKEKQEKEKAQNEKEAKKEQAAAAFAPIAGPAMVDSAKGLISAPVDSLDGEFILIIIIIDIKAGQKVPAGGVELNERQLEELVHGADADAAAAAAAANATAAAGEIQASSSSVAVASATQVAPEAAPLKAVPAGGVRIIVASKKPLKK